MESASPLEARVGAVLGGTYRIERLLARGVPEGVAQVVERALAKDRAERHPSVAKLCARFVRACPPLPRLEAPAEEPTDPAPEPLARRAARPAVAVGPRGVALGFRF